MKNYKMGLFIFIVGILFFTANIALSSERHKHHDNVVNATTVTNISQSKGIASAIASSQIHFDHSTQSFQGAVGIGAFSGDTAFSFGLAKRFRDTLISGNITQEEGRYGGGIGVRFNF